MQRERQTHGERRAAAGGDQEGGVTQCVQEKMWHFPSFSSSLIHPLSLICLPPLHQAHQPPPLLVRPCQGLKMHAAGWLALCRHGVEARLLAPPLPVHGGSRGDATRGLHPEEVSSVQAEFCDTGAFFFHTERIKLLRFRPLALFPVTPKAPPHRAVFTSGGWRSATQLHLCY